jgi:hypothetical protein
MEYLQTGIIPISLFILGVVTKIVLEYKMSDKKDVKVSKKKIIVHGLMVLFTALMIGNIIQTGLTKTWTQDLYVYILFQAFLTTLFLAFLLVLNALKVFAASLTELTEDEKNRLKELETA